MARRERVSPGPRPSTERCTSTVRVGPIATGATGVSPGSRLQAISRRCAYRYDPDNPVPSIGGNNCCGSPTPVGPGRSEHRGNPQRRAGVHVDFLDGDIDVTGPLKVLIYASSDCPDTDFVAKLVDVYPDGKAYSLAEGILRARYRESLSAPKPLEPRKVYPLRSISSEPAMSSARVTESACLSRAATSRSSTGTRIRESPSRWAPHYGRRPSSCTRRKSILRTSSFRSYLSPQRPGVNCGTGSRSQTVWVPIGVGCLLYHAINWRENFSTMQTENGLNSRGFLRSTLSDS